jgi:hypothetical protein
MKDWPTFVRLKSSSLSTTQSQPNT